VARYRFVTTMRFAAPAAAVRGIILEPEGWLGAWGDAVTFTRLADGDPDGVGRRFVAAVRAPVGYRLAARIEVVEVATLRLRMSAAGDLDGEVVWDLAARRDGATDVRFDWDVAVTKRWMRLASPLARPLFERSHGVVMRNATEAAAAHLGSPVLAFSSRPVRRGSRPVDA
jgi:hypothetical protein